MALGSAALNTSTVLNSRNLQLRMTICLRSLEGPSYVGTRRQKPQARAFFAMRMSATRQYVAIKNHDTRKSARDADALLTNSVLSSSLDLMQVFEPQIPTPPNTRPLFFCTQVSADPKFKKHLRGVLPRFWTNLSGYFTVFVLAEALSDERAQGTNEAAWVISRTQAEDLRHREKFVRPTCLPLALPLLVIS